MYATPSPHASAMPPHGAPLTTQHATQAAQAQVQHGHAQGMQAAPVQAFSAPAARPSVGAVFMTGAYQSSGDPAIDRMVRLEAACKQFGSAY